MNLSLTELAALRLAAKEREDAAIAHRREIDAEIASIITGPDEGAASQEVGGYKMTVTRKFARKVDTNKLRAEWGALTPDEQACFKWSADIETRVYRASKTILVDSYITTKPASPSVSVEAISKEQ